MYNSFYINAFNKDSEHVNNCTPPLHRIKKLNESFTMFIATLTPRKK